MESIKDYVGEIIGAAAVIVAALIGLLARKNSGNKQTIKKIENSKVCQANGSISVKEGKDEE